MRRWWLMLAIAVVAVGCGQPVAERTTSGPSTGLRFLGGDGDAGFARARVPRAFVFPADHGSHSDFRTEWWYFTGNLVTAGGRHFGFELTFFRYALAASSPPTESESAWRTDQVWMAHFAITDTANGRFIARERLTRAALDLAGAEADPLRVWVKDWSVTGETMGDDLTLQLQARDDDVALTLRLASTIAPVAQGDRGLDAKGAGDGNASYYYSIPRLAAEGEVTVGGETVAVAGLAWLDREWGTSSLEPGTVGWDWFALHLSDGGNLMFYRLRTAGGTASSFSGGTLVSVDGVRTRLAASDVEVAPVGYWTSVTGVRYPTEWRLSASKVGIVLEIKPYLENQELDLSVRYWEGAVHAEGTGSAGPLRAEGYLELAGY